MKHFPTRWLISKLSQNVNLDNRVTSRPVHTCVLGLYHGEGDVVDEVDEDLGEEAHCEIN